MERADVEFESLVCPPRAVDVGMIVPTRNEADNVDVLVQRLAVVLADRQAEIIFVDDSDDQTPARLRDLGRDGQLPPIRILHRPAGQRQGGLGGAVVEGLRATNANWVVVMDADLQHPPEDVPRLLEAARSGVDVVVASRYCAGGDAQGLSGNGRLAVSSGATRVTRAIFPRRLRPVSDPLSGFFAIRRQAVDVKSMRPVGFKVLLDLLVRSRALRVAEVPFRFAARHSGDSKAGVIEALRFMRQLLWLRVIPKAGPRGVRWVGARSMLAFGLVGLTGIAVNTVLMWMFSDRLLRIDYLIAAALATQGSTIWNFAWTDALVFRGRARRFPMAERYLRFAVVNNAVLLLRLPFLAVLVTILRISPLIANAVTLAVSFAVRFAVADRHVFAERATENETAGIGDGTRPIRIAINTSETVPVINGRRWLRYRYDIPGVATIGSEVELHELEYFRAPSCGTPFNMEIRGGALTSRRPRARASMTRYTAGAVTYREHLGALGTDFHVSFGATIGVTVGSLLARSPHVLYTNVVEALLRFLAVTRERVLLHSACVEINGEGVLLSARTDTGKTGTILRLVRNDARFLSDDMTLLAPDGTASRFPKPLTISHHTLRAVQADDLNGRERRRLRLQSRIHSKEGRTFGIRLASCNLPIMAMNAVTQMLVPPPKFDIDRLVPCQVAESTCIRQLFVIERGNPAITRIPSHTLVDELIANTDDAYGFPPFAELAPGIRLGGLSYDELRRRERSLLQSALSCVEARRIASDTFSWADTIPRLLLSEAAS